MNTMEVRKNFGFTLVELMVVVSIVVIMAIILVGIINPIALLGKARDAKRKDDLNKIRTAFEEYFNDKGKYPSSISVGNTWNVITNCDKEISEMKKYLKSWPCDPNKTPYRFAIDDIKGWFKVVVNLENKSDKDIPIDWYKEGTYSTSNFLKSEANYGTSSLNVLWYEGSVASSCDYSTCYIGTLCNEAPASTGCNSIRDGKQCYFYNKAINSCNNAGCATQCCGAGCN